MHRQEAHPYSRLTPDTVLNALEGVGFACDGRMLALASYENRVYQVGQDEGPPVVAKFYRPGRWTDAQILEEHAFAVELDAREIPVVAPLAPGGRTLNEHAGFRFAVFPRRGGRAPELEHERTLEWIGRFIGRIHAVGRVSSFVHRPSIDIASFGEEPRNWLAASGLIPPDLDAAWRSAADRALEGVRRSFETAGEIATLRLHGDCHAGNILWTDEGPHFVDLDDSRTGPAVQDLWMLLSGNPAERAIQLGHLLRGYGDFSDFEDRELHLVEALRTLRLLHYSAWLGRRWDDPAFPIAFPWFNTPRYWQDRVLELKEQVAAMQESPLRPP